MIFSLSLPVTLSNKKSNIQLKTVPLHSVVSGADSNRSIAGKLPNPAIDAPAPLLFIIFVFYIVV